MYLFLSLFIGELHIRSRAHHKRIVHVDAVLIVSAYFRDVQWWIALDVRLRLWPRWSRVVAVVAAIRKHIQIQVLFQ